MHHKKDIHPTQLNCNNILLDYTVIYRRSFEYIVELKISTVSTGMYNHESNCITHQ